MIVLNMKYIFFIFLIFFVSSCSDSENNDIKIVADSLMLKDENVSTKKHAKCIAKEAKKIFTPELWIELVELSKPGAAELDNDTKLRVGLPLGQVYIKCGVPLN